MQSDQGKVVLKNGNKINKDFIEASDYAMFIGNITLKNRRNKRKSIAEEKPKILEMFKKINISLLTNHCDESQKEQFLEVANIFNNDDLLIEDNKEEQKNNLVLQFAKSSSFV